MTDLEKLKKFAREFISTECWGYQPKIDGETIQEVAEKCGLLEEHPATKEDCVTYAEYDIEVGDPIYKFTDVLKEQTMAKKSKRRRLQDRLDELCKKLTRAIFQNTCERCHKEVFGQNSHPHHVIAKGTGSSWRRFDLLNLILLCFHCHRWWHDNVTEADRWWLSTEIGKSRDEYLDKFRGGKPCPITDVEMKKLQSQYKQKLKEV